MGLHWICGLQLRSCMQTVILVFTTTLPLNLNTSEVFLRAAFGLSAEAELPQICFDVRRV